MTWFTVLKYGEENANGRIYDIQSLSEDARKVLMDRVEQRQLLGTIGHPTDLASSVNMLEAASHVITDVKEDENGLYAKLEFLDTAPGAPIKKIVEDRGMSDFALGLRATGEVSIDGKVSVQDVLSIDVIPRHQWSFDPDNVRKYQEDS